ncbi:hypothetical protein [Paenibacillus puerhi]|uniref:hypothetical protein n=1 Tax=Paenibacillus puerhi TaxID=2692622 RepID=UPI00135CDADB|nr:hypothetical protein [Paenibacillus puerhi]
MALFYLSSDIHMPIDSRYVESFNLYVQNFGNRSFDLLVQASQPAQPAQPLLLRLQRIQPVGLFGSTFSVFHNHNGYQPFYVQIATNIRNKDSIGILFELLQGEHVIARITHEYAGLNKLE